MKPNPNRPKTLRLPDTPVRTHLIRYENVRSHHILPVFAYSDRFIRRRGFSCLSERIRVTSQAVRTLDRTSQWWRHRDRTSRDFTLSWRLICRKQECRYELKIVSRQSTGDDVGRDAERNVMESARLRRVPPGISQCSSGVTLRVLLHSVQHSYRWSIGVWKLGLLLAWRLR